MIGSLHFLKCDSAISRIFNLGGDRSLLGRWSDRSGNKPRLVRSLFGEFVGCSSSISDRRKIDLANDFIGEVKIRQTNRTGVKRIGLDDIRTGCQILAMDINDIVRPSQTENIGAVFQVFVVIGEAVSANVFFLKPQSEDHRSHCAIETEDSFV